jgi:hypothetical protein
LRARRRAAFGYILLGGVSDKTFCQRVEGAEIVEVVHVGMSGGGEIY